MATLLEPARAKGIQIVSWGVGAKGWEIGKGKPMTSMVAYDFYALGQQMGKAVCEKYPDGAKLGYLHWINNFSSIRLREQGFLDTLKKDCPKIEVIADGGPPDPTKPNSGYKDPNASQPTTEAFLTRHPEVNVLFGAWEDPPALGQIAAIRSRKKLGKVDIVTMDLGPTGAEQLKAQGRHDHGRHGAGHLRRRARDGPDRGHGRDRQGAAAVRDHPDVRNDERQPRGRMGHDARALLPVLRRVT